MSPFLSGPFFASQSWIILGVMIGLFPFAAWSRIGRTSITTAGPIH